ncbi:hypothetical protein D9613_002369 [Agrocybe pediades]|uniref:Uncharacterized protein n=1 Tax=Agrocybe pediades TaxID=84607 RepID=A0A8H4R5E3_9AGAR|nr:hypothetical protein D9613_002369 [Agrocybe pediades]
MRQRVVRQAVSLPPSSESSSSSAVGSSSSSSASSVSSSSSSSVISSSSSSLITSASLTSKTSLSSTSSTSISVPLTITDPLPPSTSAGSTPPPNPQPSESSKGSLGDLTSPTTIPTPDPFLLLNGTSASPTENITTIVSTVDGRVTTFTSHLPTTLAESKPSLSGSKRSGIIAGATAGFVAFILLLLAAIFAYRKHKLSRELAMSEKKREAKGLLDGEEFDDADDDITRSTHGPATHTKEWGSWKDFKQPSTVGRENMLRARVSESGSIFREEVWPPPGLVDPIKDRNSKVDLSNIVADVMGPGSTPQDAAPLPSPDHHIASFHEPSPLRNSTGTVDANAPAAPTLRVANHAGHTEPWDDPFESPGPPSIHSSLPPGAMHPSTPGASPPSASPPGSHFSR